MIMEPYTLYKCDPVSDCDQKDRDKQKAAYFSRNILSSKFRVSNTDTHTYTAAVIPAYTPSIV